MKCREFEAVAESYQAGELPVEINHEVRAHLERCPECRAELEARAALRLTLRNAFRQVPTLAPDPSFVAGLRGTLLAPGAAAPRRVFGQTSWLALAASLFLVAALGWVVGWGPGRHLIGVDPGAAPSAAVSALAAHAAGDHRYCALEHALDEPVISLSEAARRHNPVYGSLRDVVAESAALREGGFEVLGAHWCVFKGQPFGHVVARRGAHVVSILVTPASDASPSGSVAAACQSADGLQVACFDAPGHGVFVVSDLSSADVLALAERLAPVLQAYLAET